MPRRLHATQDQAGGPPVTQANSPTVELEPWSGPWEPDDPDANLKADVAAHSLLDPLETVKGLSRSTGIPVGALARYVLARWATAGSGGLLELGPTMTARLWEPVAAAESADDDARRLEAYHQLRQVLSWLRFPLEHPDAYPEQR
jgi:uncharacterized protein DUF6027